MIPRVGEAIKTGRRYRLRPGAYVILALGEQVLLTVQMDEAPDIQLPGGGLDPGESPVAALHREVLEETGWRMTRPTRFGAFRRFVFMPEYNLWAEKLCTVYVASPALQVCEPLEPHHSALWLTFPEAIGALGNDGDRLMMSRFAAGQSPW